MENILDVDLINSQSLRISGAIGRTVAKSIPALFPTVSNSEQFAQFLRHQCKYNLSKNIANFLSKDDDIGIQTKLSSLRETYKDFLLDEILYEHLKRELGIDEKERKSKETIINDIIKSKDEEVAAFKKESLSLILDEDDNTLSRLKLDIKQEEFNIIKSYEDIIKNIKNKLDLPIHIDDESMSRVYILLKDKIIQGAIDLIVNLNHTVPFEQITHKDIEITNISTTIKEKTTTLHDNGGISFEEDISSVIDKRNKIRV